MSPPARQHSALAGADPPSGPSLPQDVRSQHATDHQSPASAATGISNVIAHGNATEAVSPEERQSQPSPNMMLSSHPLGTSGIDTAERPDPLPGDSSAHEPVMQQGTAQQSEGANQQPGPMPTGESDASAPEEGHAPRLAMEALGSELDDENEGIGPEQESDSAMQDEEDRFGELGLPSEGPGLGSESDFLHEPSSVADATAGEMELPEEGWMWLVAHPAIMFFSWPNNPKGLQLSLRNLLPNALGCLPCSPQTKARHCLPCRGMYSMHPGGAFNVHGIAFLESQLNLRQACMHFTDLQMPKC